MNNKANTSEKLPDISELLKMIQLAEDHIDLENIGKALSSNELLAVYKLISLKKLPQTKLGPILVGLNPQVFSESILQIDKEALNILKVESGTEPLLHQLTLFVNNTKAFHEKTLVEIDSLRHAFTHFERVDLTYNILQNWLENIQTFATYYRNDLAAIDTILEICWNTDRIDLIEKLSRMKEHAVDQLMLEVGNASNMESPSTGLYETLKDSLEEVYNQADLTDDTHATEGLVQFSVWYLKDYWEIGLLPSVKIIEQLEAAPGSSDQDNVKYKQKFFKLVEENLEKLGISTVGDLKSAAIFSKKMLQEFISHHQQQL